MPGSFAIMGGIRKKSLMGNRTMSTSYVTIDPYRFSTVRRAGAGSRQSQGYNLIDKH